MDYIVCGGKKEGMYTSIVFVTREAQKSTWILHE